MLHEISRFVPWDLHSQPEKNWVHARTVPDMYRSKKRHVCAQALHVEVNKTVACCRVSAMVVIRRDASKSPTKKLVVPVNVIVRGSQGNDMKLLSLNVPGMSVSNITWGATPRDDTCCNAHCITPMCCYGDLILFSLVLCCLFFGEKSM